MYQECFEKFKLQSDKSNNMEDELKKNIIELTKHNQELMGRVESLHNQKDTLIKEVQMK